MLTPSIYINLEDDVSKVIARIKKERSSELILVCPKRCFLFNDSINLRLLKKQVDLLAKKVFVMTMDEKGQTFAKEAGFELKYLTKPSPSKGFSDISVNSGKTQSAPTVKPGEKANPVSQPTQKTAQIFSKVEQPKAAEEKKPIEEASESFFSVASSQQKNERLFPKELEVVHRQKTKQKRQNRLIISFSVFALLVAFAVVFVILPKAEVTMFNKSQNLTRDLVISVSSQAKTSDIDGLVLPGQKVSQAGFAKNTFNTQGKKEIGNKASGSVVIYNFTGAPINLKAKTTIFTLNNRNYELTGDAMQIKPTRYKNAATKEVDQKSLSGAVSVQASGGGEDYNIPAGTRLEISNQVFGSRPQVLYAKASTAITGGTSRYLSVVSAQDISSAKDSLQKSLIQNIQNDLAAKNLKLEDGAALVQDPSVEFDKAEGTESPQFSGRMAGQVNGVAYSSKDLENLVLSRVRKSLSAPENLDIKLTQSLNIKVKSLEANNGLLVLEVHFDGKAVAINKNLDSIKGQLILKNQSAAAEYIKQNAQVDKVEITLVPGWQSWMPILSTNIKISQNQ